MENEKSMLKKNNLTVALKLEVMEYLIHYVRNVNILILCKLLILFSTLELKLGHSFSEFIHRFKIGIFECWC